MINMRVFIKKIQFLIIISCLVSQVSANSITDEIVKLFWEDQSLDRKIIENLVFELAVGQSAYRGQSTEKYLLKDNEGNLWLFKTYIDSIHVKNDITVYQLAQLFGIGVPTICEINLPINGEIVYGSIQKIILDVEFINKDLLPNQISDIQRHHILDWLVSNYDAGGDEFLVKKNTGEIIAIDKDDSFCRDKALSPGDDPWGYLYYTNFWESYTKGEINVNFAMSFKLIDHVQSFKDSLFINILKSSFRKIVSKKDMKKIINLVILKKKNLKTDFRKFYQELAKKSVIFFYIPVDEKENKYSQQVLGKLKKERNKKSNYLKKLISKNRNKQKNIEIISSKKAWYMVDELEYSPFGQFFLLSNKIVHNLRNLRNEVLSFSEKLAISLYIEQVNQMRREREWKGIGKEEPKRITENSKNIEGAQIEYILRTSYGLFKKPITEYKKEVEKAPYNLLAHINYIQIPLDDPDRERMIEEYRKKLNREPNNLIYQLVYGILTCDSEYLKKTENGFVWKHLVLGCLRDDKREYEKVINLDKDEIASYWAHILLGELIEHNNEKIRFGEGFDMDNAITNYKKAIEIKPDSMEAHLNLASLYLIKGLSEEALKEFKKIEKLDSQYAREHFHLNKIREKKSYKSKKEYLEEIRRNTLSGEQHYVLALACAVKKENKLAKEHFSQANKFGYKVDIKLK